MRIAVLEQKTIKPHFGCRWLMWAYGMAICRHVFFRETSEEVSRGLFVHELVHVRQFESLALFGWMWTSFIPFLVVYVWHWVGAGFSYRGNRLEKEAYAMQDSIEWPRVSVADESTNYIWPVQCYVWPELDQCGK